MDDVKQLSTDELVDACKAADAAYWREFAKHQGKADIDESIRERRRLLWGEVSRRLGDDEPERDCS